MKNLNLIFICLVAFITFLSCEDEIDPDLESADPVINVDAWINNKPEVQVIYLQWSQEYFDNTTPPGISDATVTISDDGGRTYTFIEDQKEAGKYLWMPDAGENFGVIGQNYQLEIAYQGEVLHSSSKMNRTTTVDSITFRLNDGLPFYPDDAYIGEFWGKDHQGSGDAYWIKNYKNGVLQNKPSEINIAFDAGTSRASNFDGQAFLTPIRSGINPMNEDEDEEPLAPYDDGDEVRVEIHSITVEAYDYLNEVIIQTDRPGGLTELFSTPLANVATNIINTDGNGTQVVGFFNVSAVSSNAVVFRK